MDEAIRKLKSTTFFGRRLTRRQIADVQCTVRDFPKLSPIRTWAHHLRTPEPAHPKRRQSRPHRAALARTPGGAWHSHAAGKGRIGSSGGHRRRWYGPPAPRHGRWFTRRWRRLEPLALRVITEQDEVEAWNETAGTGTITWAIAARSVRTCATPSSTATAGGWVVCCSPTRPGRCCAATSSSAGTRRLGRSVWTRSSVTAASCSSRGCGSRIWHRRPCRCWCVGWRTTGRRSTGYRPVLVETFVDLSRFRGTLLPSGQLAVSGRDPGQGVGANAERRFSSTGWIRISGRC